MLESIDNGKPIRESRDVDLPLVAAHFFYYAGWADKLGYAGLGPDPRPLGVAAQVIPWNFPLLMLAWKIAPALASGNTVVLKPAETTPLTALAFADICRQADLPPGVVNIVTGAGDTGRALVEHPGVDKVAFTGSTEVGRQIARSVAGTRKKVTLELGGKAANIVFDDAPLDQAVEGIVNGIFFNQGHVCCAGSRLLVQESIADELLDRLKRRLATLRLGDPLDKNTDIGAINSPEQLDRIRELSDVGEEEGAERWSPPCELPDRGCWFPPTVFTGVTQAHRIAREEIFGPVLSVLTFRTPGRGAGEGQQHALRPVGRRVDRQGQPHPLDGPAAAGRRGVGQHVQPLRPHQPVRGLQGVGLRPRGRPPRAGGLPRCRPRRTAGASAVRKTYKLYVGGAFPRSESGRTYEVTRRDGRFLANAALASRKDARDAVVAARKAFGGWSGATAYNRGQVLYRVAEMLEGRRDQFVAEVAEAEGLAAPPPAAWSTPPSTAGSGTPDGATRSPRSRGSSNPVAGPYFDFSVPEPTGVVAVVAPRLVAAGARVGGRPGDRGRQHLRGGRPAGRPAAGHHAVRGARHLRPPRRGGQPAHRRRRRDRPLARLPHGRQRDRPRRRRRPRAGGRPRARARPTTSSASSAAPAAAPDWSADPGLERMLAFLETKTVWHPVGA